MKSVVYLNKDAAYFSKKHFCPECKSELKKIKVSKIVNSDSKESEEMPKMFSRTIIGSRGIKFRNYNYLGDVKYIWKELKCDICQCQFTAEEMRKIESVPSFPNEELSENEIKKISVKRLLFNKVFSIAVIILILIIHYLVTKP